MKRNGSALLVVLGVLSFLVVSAVAFSAFMRRARQPSSYLRRVVASRQLAKAAVARAIDEIDIAIANGVHPNVGGTSYNTWRDRVFFRGGSEQNVTMTTPTLTLEGLAYIPPPLVNEARYWSRKTPTAVWQPFGYDVGRYAYCAIDVSDYFDVNRLVADYPRSSAANRRVTIAHLFEDVNHRQAPSGADAWDKFMEKFRKIDDETLELDFESGSKIPLVSIADFNLALNEKGSVGSLKSPFGEYIQKASGNFYPASSQKELETYASMTFVTDGWFPKSSKRTQADANGNAKTTKTYDLAEAKYQPFTMASLQKNKLKLSQAVLGNGMNTQSGETRDIWLNRLSGLGCAALADYLDADRTPLSLAIPTTERVPMICGISPQLPGNPLFKVSVEGKDGDPTVQQTISPKERRVSQKVAWKIGAAEFKAAFERGHVQALVAYPFLHKDADDPQAFKVDGQLSLFFSSTDLGLRTSAQDVLHLTQQQIQQSSIKDGVFRVKLKEGRPSMKTLTSGIAETEEDAVWDSSTALSLQEGSQLATELSQDGRELLVIEYAWTQRKVDENADWSPSLSEIMGRDVSGDNSVTVQASCGLPALTAEGKVDTDFTDNLSQKVKNPNWSKEIRLNLAVWLRVVNPQDNNKVVDLVPACINDDRTQNNVNDPDTRVQIIGQDEFAGKPYPLMRFDTGVKLFFGVQKLSEFAEQNAGGVPIAVTPKSAMVGDPRFNYAPEHWFKWTSENLSAAEWLKNNYVGGDGHDGDIFMATSDAGYLQSIYELAFLPRFTNLRTTGGTVASGNLQPPGTGNLTELPAQGQERNKNLMWISYDPIDLDEVAFNELPFTSEGSGMKVNPYSNSTNVLMAAFANTPVDWRRASTNKMAGASEDYATMDVATFNKKYAWNEYSSGGKFAWDDLERVAGLFMERIRKAGNSGWQTVWNDLGWYDSSGDGESFLGMKMTDTDELWDIDRKFFYGFWRDCFDAKQQLFLIFVRAEPLLLGGGSADQLPPQLGARAVALVWRDPASSVNYPHRTRLLFYRPLD